MGCLGRSFGLGIVLIPLGLALANCGGSTVKIGENDLKLQTNSDGSATGNGKTCTLGGTTVNVGQSFTAPDGCNNCTCAADGAYCTERACAGDGGTGGNQCKGSDGKIHNVGDSYPDANGCNTCSCTANGEICTKRACLIDCSAPGACSGPMPGMPNIQCADGTTGGPVCASTGANSCGWTIRSCECKDANGTVHKAGDSWTDQCNNSCSCDQQGRAACTAMACACPPNGTVDCMPPVPTTRASLCSGPYHNWVVANCPGVSFAY